MSGILYKSNFNTKTDLNKFFRACDTMNHRGPDDEGYLFTKLHSFGHKRLAIMNPINALQPMSDVNQHLIYNGEIYNYDELSLLLDDKLSFKSDTLLLLKLLNKYKMEILNKINGMFSFVYTDNEAIYVVRDMFGIKPLYYTIVDNDIIAASEIKAILAYTNNAIVTAEGLCELLGMGPSHSKGKTIYKDIYELPPGHYLKYDGKDLVITEYYRIPAYNYKKSYNDTVIMIKDLVEKAIKRELISDVDASAFLSGGLDSSIISTLASRTKDKLDTYTVLYTDNEELKPNEFERSNDTLYAKMVSDDIKSNFNLAMVTNEDIISNLKRAVDLRDAPGMTDIDSSLICAANSVSEKYKVVLSGECADEIFGGYSWYYNKEKEYKVFPWIRGLEYRESLLNDKWKERLKLYDYVKKEYRRAIKAAPMPANVNELDRRHREMTYINIKYFMTNLLDRKDRMTMGSSLEARVPFCDKDLVEALYNIPFKYKYKSKVEKKLLRDAFTGEVLDEAIKRKKSPYPKSNSIEYTNMIKKLLKDALEDKSSILHELFNIDKLNELIDSSNELDVPWYGQLMRKTALMAYLYQIDYWYKKYNVRIEY